ncbi:MAG: hypothetical protein HQK52_15495 [Oligoflexia bacterium]|nr:hypothetical protein [Oligoflexia bacterium]
MGISIMSKKLLITVILSMLAAMSAVMAGGEREATTYLESRDTKLLKVPLSILINERAKGSLFEKTFSCYKDCVTSLPCDKEDPFYFNVDHNSLRAIVTYLTSGKFILDKCNQEQLAVDIKTCELEQMGSDLTTEKKESLQKKEPWREVAMTLYTPQERKALEMLLDIQSGDVELFCGKNPRYTAKEIEDLGLHKSVLAQLGSNAPLLRLSDYDGNRMFTYLHFKPTYIEPVLFAMALGRTDLVDCFFDKKGVHFPWNFFAMKREYESFGKITRFQAWTYVWMIVKEDLFFSKLLLDTLMTEGDLPQLGWRSVFGDTSPQIRALLRERIFDGKRESWDTYDM